MKFIFIIPVLVIITIMMAFAGGTYSVDGGNTAVIQNTLNGSLEVVQGPKFGFKVPFATSVTYYRDVSTVSFGDSTDENTRNLPATSIRFADTYTADINVSFRFKLPTDPTAMLRLHTEFRSYDNMIDSLLVKNATNVTVLTATQYTGEEFFQGAQNSYKERLEDQMQRGIFETVRQQVEVDTVGLASVSSENNKSGTLETAKQLVWKTVPVLDGKGEVKRQRNPLQSYGIEVTQVTMGNAAPEELLNKLLTDKKTLVGKRIRTIQEQETAQAEADTQQLLKEIERIKAVQDANRAKELAVIGELQLVEVAKQQANKETVVQEKEKALAVIDKQKELEVARAGLSIQKANAEAAIFQANAAKEIGLAEAQVLDAKYKALGANKEIYLAEIQRDVSVKLYENLGSFKVEVPQNYVSNGGDNAITSNLDILSSYATLGTMNSLKSVVTAPAVQ